VEKVVKKPSAAKLRPNRPGILPAGAIPGALLRALSAAGLLLLLGGCTTLEPVAAWERGYLADAAMQWDDSPREARLRGHVYASKEASQGGSGSAGGGCGCN
jgi:hypothetical protein